MRNCIKKDQLGDPKPESEHKKIEYWIRVQRGSVHGGQPRRELKNNGSVLSWNSQMKSRTDQRTFLLKKGRILKVRFQVPRMLGGNKEEGQEADVEGPTAWYKVQDPDKAHSARGWRTTGAEGGMNSDYESGTTALSIYSTWSFHYEWGAQVYLGKCNLKTETRINQILQALVTLQENSLARKSESQWRQEDNSWKSEIRNPVISSAEENRVGLCHSKGQKYRATKERMYSIMKETGKENRWITLFGLPGRCVTDLSTKANG